MLAPKQWLGASIGELYALLLCIRHSQQHVRYVPFSFSQRLSSPDVAECHTFHNLHDGQLQLSKPVVFVRHAQHHFYVVAFDYQNSRSVTFGRIFDGSVPSVGPDEWEQWNGPQLWTSIAMLHGFIDISMPVVTEAVNWKQVSGTLDRHRCV